MEELKIVQVVVVVVVVLVVVVVTDRLGMDLGWIDAVQYTNMGLRGLPLSVLADSRIASSDRME